MSCSQSEPDTDRLAFALLHFRDAHNKGNARVDEDAGTARDGPPQLRRSSDEIVDGLTKASGADKPRAGCLRA